MYLIHKYSVFQYIVLHGFLTFNCLMLIHLLFFDIIQCSLQNFLFIFFIVWGFKKLR